MASTYFEHHADMGIVGCGMTVEQSFEAAAQAVFSMITNLEAIQPSTTITLEFEETDLELALVSQERNGMMDWSAASKQRIKNKTRDHKGLSLFINYKCNTTGSYFEPN